MLIGIFAAVSSYFFDRDSGFGFSFGSKKSDGYSRWAKKSEVKKQLKVVDPKAYSSDAAGIVVINDVFKIFTICNRARQIICRNTTII